jgi:type IV pilus assembly protein PilM
MQRVIGLDIGSYSIKAVEIVNTFKSYEIANFYENVIPTLEDVDPDVVIPACMEQLFLENQLKADRIITAMPGQYISSRVMSFGFSDPRKIEAAIYSELEDAVPFDMDDMIIDHQILGSKEGDTVTLAVMTRKTFLRSFLEHLQRINIDPKLVDVDSLAFYNLASHMNLPSGECLGLVDVGHEKTSVCIVQDGVLRMFRSINLGGRYLSEFLARDLETNFMDAQRVKHRVSRVICDDDPATELTGEDRLVVERLTLASNSIVKELGRTFYAFKNWEKSPITRLWISGGTSRIKNFDKYLADQLEMPVEANQLDRSTLKFNPDLQQYMAIMPQSVAIGMRAVTTMKRHSQINLRRGEFAFVQNYESLLRGATVAFKVVAVALFLLSMSYGVKYFFYKRQIDILEAQFTKEYQSIFPGTKSGSGPKVTFQKQKTDAFQRLQKEISTRQLAISTFIAENSASPALKILQSLSEGISKDLKVEVTLFQYNAIPGGGGKLVLKGETDSYASAESVLDAMKKIKTLKNIEQKQSGPKPGTDNKIIEFTIHGDYDQQGASEVPKA